MGMTGLWMARLLPILGIAAHVAGSIMVHYRADQNAGAGVMMLAWAGLMLYSAIFYLRGDYIQRALNAKPWAGRDEMQQDASRRAMTRGYIVTLGLVCCALGLSLDAFTFEGPATQEELANEAWILFLWITNIAYIGVAYPTAHLGWTLRPVTEADEAQG